LPFSNDAANAMTFSTHLPINLVWWFQGCLWQSPIEIKHLATRNMVMYAPIARAFFVIFDDELKKNQRKCDLDCL